MASYDPRDGRLVRHAVPTILALLLTACGGSSNSPSTPGTPGGGGGGNTAPTASIDGVLGSLALLTGDGVTITYTAGDPDDEAQVSVLADPTPGSPGDEVTLFGPVTDGNGASADVALVANVPLGRYDLVLRVDDGENPPVEVVHDRPLVVYPALAGVAAPRSNRYGVDGNHVVFSRGEAEDGNQAFNGDSLADDGVVHVYDTGTGTLTNGQVSIDTTSTGVPQVGVLEAVAGTFAWLTHEADENANLNQGNFGNGIGRSVAQDVDMTDTMVSWVQPSASPTPTTNLFGGALGIVGIDVDQVIVAWSEAQEGAGGSDLNGPMGDGDAVDVLFGYIDLSLQTPLYEYDQIAFWPLAGGLSGPTPQPGDFGHVSGAATSFRVPEAAQGMDYNLDGDMTDTALVQGGLTGSGGSFAPLGNFVCAIDGLATLGQRRQHDGPTDWSHSQDADLVFAGET